MKISYSSAVCGAGKTHQIVNRACELARVGDNVLIVQPTKQLIDKTVESELLNRTNPPAYEVFHGDKYPGKVAKELMTWLKAFGSEDGHIVFITHQLLPHIPYFRDKRRWHIFIDEAPQVHDRHTLRIPHSHSLLTSHLRLESYNAIYSRLVCENAKAVTDIAQNKDKDEVFELLSQAARDVKNRNWDCYVNAERFERLRCGEAKELDIYTVLSPTILDGFRSVFIASANFRDTALYRLWGQKGIEFKEDTEFTASLQFDHHGNGELIKIFYAIDKPWSRRRQGEKWPVCGNQTSLELFAEFAVDLLGNRPFVWQANKDESNALRPLFGDNAQLPHLAHGLNKYSDINNVILLTASNPTPDQYRFLKNQGMDRDEVRRAIYFQNAYQTILRTSIRDPNNTEPKLIIVPDLPLAEYLQQLFSGSVVERLPTSIPASGRQAKLGRPRKHRNDRERKAQHGQRKKQELIRSMLLLDRNRPYVARKTLCVRNIGDETPIDILTEFRPSCSCYLGTIFKSKHTKSVRYMIGTNVDAFIDWLEHLSKRTFAEKDANQLISPGIFDPNHPDREGNQARGLGNIVYLRHLWLDFEHGDLQPEELPKLFPNIRMVVTNSFHHQSSKPRFRALIPVKNQLTPDAYVALWDIIAGKLEDAGYEVVRKSNENKKSTTTPDRPQSGLDWSKRTPASLFYLPSQAEDPPHSFFVDYNDEKRAILDAEVWLKNTVIPFRLPPSEIRSEPYERRRWLNQAMIDAATENWRQSATHVGEGNDRFWDYALELRAAGMSLNQIEAKLYAEADYARNPNQRLSEIPWIMKTLRKPRRKVG